MCDLIELNSQIIACRRCPRLVVHRERMARVKRRAYRDETYWGRPVPACGDPSARVLLVGLAPGAHGSNRTGRMFTGDGSAEFLTPALYRAGFASQPTSTHAADGLRLEDLYIAAVAHCAPPGNRPSTVEIARCRPFLIAHLDALPRLQVVIALGQLAFQGVLQTVQAQAVPLPTPKPRFAHRAEALLPGFTLLASYHPSRQNTQTGRLTVEMFDQVFRRARQLLV
ncbi:MAG: uracil-DNA glycosylase [Anaerolineales bacterium]|jgi:uracil-DNA glycosylase family 4|nr:uracil-DNA glycosylase [Anaerolineales bacterium]